MSLTSVTFSCVLGIILLALLNGAEAKGSINYEPMVVCPIGFTMYGGKGCVKTITVDSEPICKNKGHLNIMQQSCITENVTFPTRSCSPGFVAKGKKCIQEVRRPLQLSCPEGYESKYNSDDKKQMSCVRRSFEPVTIKCPNGFLLENDLCVRAVKSVAVHTCPNGYGESKHGCEKVVGTQATKICPKYHQLINGICVKRSEYPSKIECPGGFKLEGRITPRCLQHMKTDPEVVCPVGDLKGKYCERLIEDVPFTHCPKEYQQINGSCVKESKHEPAMKCDHGFHSDGHQCIRIAKSKPDILCGPGTEMKLGKCERTITRSAEYHCKNGQRLVNGQCIEEQIKESYVKCPKGFKQIHNGACKKVNTVKAEQHCPHGYDLLKNGDCGFTETISPEILCNDGGEYIDGKCRRIVQGTSVQDCPKLSSLDTRTNQCIRKTSNHPEYSCPHGSVEAKFGKCEAVVKERPQVSCPKEYSLGMNNQCTRMETAKPKSFCPSDTDIKGQLCVPKKSHEKHHGKEEPEKTYRQHPYLGKKGQ